MTLLEELKNKCIYDNIPIVRDETLLMINNYIQRKSNVSMLELGAAYGYSAYQFAQNKQLSKIISIEKDHVRYKIASTFLSNNQKIKLINEDIFAYKPTQLFDFIFVDGPKSHQKEIVEKYLFFLSNDGIMFIDNIYLKKIRNQTNLTKNKRCLIYKIDEFRQWLIQYSKLNVKILDIDDGVAIISKSS